MRDIIDKAISILDDCGWVQGECNDDQGRVCMGTALCRAAGLPEDGNLTPAQLGVWVTLTDAVLSAQQDLFPGFDATNCVAKFNDFSTEADVRMVLEAMREKN